MECASNHLIILVRSPSCELLPQTRQLSCHRASITKVGRQTFTRTYPTVLVLPDGATISVRYPVPRQIIKVGKKISFLFVNYVSPISPELTT